MNYHHVSGILLVLDEWRSVRAAALSILPYVDELVFIQTTPKDSITELLRKEVTSVQYYNKVQYHHIPQASIERYSYDEEAIRNHAVSLCKYDWILQIDADEVIDEGNPDYFRTYEAPIRFKFVNLFDIAHMIVAAYRNGDWVSWYPDLHVRYFNRTTAEYFGHRHCQPVFKSDGKLLKNCQGIVTSKLRFWHFNALSKETAKAYITDKPEDYITDELYQMPPMVSRYIQTIG